MREPARAKTMPHGTTSSSQLSSARAGRGAAGPAVAPSACTPTPMPTDSADDRHMPGPRTAEAQPITDESNGLMVDDPKIRRGLVEAIDSYTGDLPQGPHPPGAVNWSTDDRDNKAFLAQTVVAPPNGSLSIPNAPKRSDRTTTATTWPPFSGRSALVADSSRFGGRCGLPELSGRGNATDARSSTAFS
jgi:hypothetical protein